MRISVFIGALFSIILSTSLLAGEARDSFYCQEGFSASNIINKARSVALKLNNAEFQSDYKKALNGDAQAIQNFITRIDDKDWRIHTVGIVGLVATMPHDDSVILQVTERLQKLHTLPVDERFGQMMNLTSVAVALGKKAAPMIPALVPFLDSSNFHEIYWALKGIISTREGAAKLAPQIIRLALSEGSLASVKRHAVLALGSIGISGGNEVLEAISTALDAPLHPVREAAIISTINLGEDATDEMKLKVKNLLEKRFTHLIEGSVAMSIFNDDLSIIEQTYDRNPHQFIYSSATYLMPAYIKHLGADADELGDFFMKIMKTDNIEFQNVGASYVVYMGEFASDELKEKAAEIFEKKSHKGHSH